jgi:hypothetical protein
LEQEREKKHRSRVLKPFNRLSNSMKTKRVHMFNNQLAINFTNTAAKYFHPDDCLLLQEVHFSVQDKNFQASFGIQSKEKENQRNEAFTKVIDQGPIARDSYRNLAALQPELPRETTIYKTKKRINEEMINAIPISILNISDQPSLTSINENPDINDPEVVEEVLKYIGKAGYRKITDILLFILPDLINRHVVNPDNPIINLRISGDGRNVGRKVKHVIVTCAILDDIVNLYKADHHYTVILYPGNENYELLQRMITPLSNELNDLVLNGLSDQDGTNWKINPYFSSDWKFMAIVLGFNAPNSKYFCPWCLCTKENIGNKYKTCTIEKNMDQIKPSFFDNNSSVKPPPGHIKPPLLQMIPLSHYVPDELHIMLRIWDRLWELALQELKIQNQFNDSTRIKIIAEMRRISVSFHFWQEQGTQNWSYTSLMGGDKEIVLKSFNFEVVFNEERASLINQLWRNFYQLYHMIKSQKTNPTQFANQAKQWLDLFLTPSQGEPNTITFKKGLYRPKDVTPYIHVLVHHLPEFMEQHQKFGLGAFSCSAVEKKNHDQVSAFFRKTMKDGGKGVERKSAIFEILHYENRSMYFAQKGTTDKYSRPQHIHVKKLKN